MHGRYGKLGRGNGKRTHHDLGVALALLLELILLSLLQAANGGGKESSGNVGSHGGLMLVSCGCGWKWCGPGMETPALTLGRSLCKLAMMISRKGFQQPHWPMPDADFITCCITFGLKEDRRNHD